MFKGFSQNEMFHGFPEGNFGMNASTAFGFNNVVFWMDAAQGLNSNVNLDPISSWTDLITGYRFEQATAGNQPRWVASDARFNGYPVVQAVNTARRMVGNRLISGIRCLAFVANFDTLNSGNAVLGYSPAQTHFVILGGSFGGYNGVGTRNGINTLACGYTEDTTVKIGVISNNGVWVNGVQEYSGDTYIGLYGFDTVLGSSNTNSYGLTGSLAEMIGYGASHDELSLSDALNAKYAIY